MLQQLEVVVLVQETVVQLLEDHLLQQVEITEVTHLLEIHLQTVEQDHHLQAEVLLDRLHLQEVAVAVVADHLRLVVLVEVHLLEEVINKIL